MTQSSPQAETFEPPSGALIARTQASLPALRLLVAQARLHGRSKRWSSFRYLGVGVIAIAAPLVTTFEPDSAVGLAAIAGLWIFLSRTVVARRERFHAAKGVVVQEKFDRFVFAMPRLSRRTVALTLEEVNRIAGDDVAVDKYVHKHFELPWYPIDSELEGADAIAIAQRANGAYSQRLLSLHANVWLFSTVGWSLFAVALSMIAKLDLSTFILGVLLPLLPALLDTFDQWVVVRQASTHRLALALTIEDAIREEGELTVNAEQLLLWQEQIFVLRMSTPQVPNFLYRQTRKSNERAMNAAAEQLAALVKDRKS